MRIKGEWEGVPGFWIDDDYSPDGKRFVATHYGWEKIEARVKSDAREVCALHTSANCPGRTQWGDVHHVYGRGGGKREDRPVVRGIVMLVYGCRPCHNEVRIKRRLPKVIA